MASGDVFDDLGEAFAQEAPPSPLTGIFAPEFIASSDPDLLLAATRGVFRTISSRFHPDKLPIEADQTIIERARSLKAPYPPDEDPEVIKVRTQMDQGALLIGQWRKKVEQVEADPLEAKMQALRDIKKAAGRLPVVRPTGRQQSHAGDRQTESTEPPLSLQLPELDVNALDSVPVRKAREQQETLFSPEALHTVDNLYVLSMSDPQHPILFALRAGGGVTGSPDQYYRVLANPLTLLKPRDEVAEAWQKTVKQLMVAAEYEPTKKDLAVLTEDGGLKLAFRNIEEAHTGRSVPARIFRELGARPHETPYFHPYRYQLAVLNATGQYEYMPTVMGDAYGYEAETDDGSLRDWALNVYGVTPDVLYVVNEAADNVDGRVLYAYEGSGEQLLFGGADEPFMGESKRLKLIGFLDNLATYEEGAGEGDGPLLTAGAVSDNEVNPRESLIPLRENLDVLLYTGLRSDFSPVLRLHQKKPITYSRDFGLVFSIEYRLDDETFNPEEELDQYMPIASQQVFAVRAPVVVGVIREGSRFAYLARQGLDAERQEAVVERISTIIRTHWSEVVGGIPTPKRR